MNAAINWGVLGAASIAIQRTIPALLESPSAALLAIGSRDGDKARQVANRFGIPRAYDSYDAVLADPDVDAVYVPLPNQLHCEWAAKALAARKHVLCEKPLCLTSTDVERLRTARDRSGCRIEEAFAYRNHPQWEKLLELTTDGSIGAVRAVHAVLAKQFLDPADIRNNPDAGGGALYDLGSYAVNACLALLQKFPSRVVATLERDPQMRIDRLSSALLDCGDRHATLTAATQSGPAGWATHQQLSVVGSTGWLRCDFPYAHAIPTPCRIEWGDVTSVGSQPTATILFEPVNQYARQTERFSQLVLGKPVAHWPIEDSLRTLQVLEALFESARRGAWVTPGITR